MTGIKSKGFTLVELMVVMAVFLFVIGGAIAIFISIIQQQRRILSEQELLNQTSYVMEYMSKALRMAKNDTAGSCLIDGSGNSYLKYNYLLGHQNGNYYEGIKFINASNGNICQEFYLNSGILWEKKAEAGAVALTSAGLNIKSLKFALNGNTALDHMVDDIGIQPRVTISMEIETVNSKEEPARIIQTTVSQRNLNQQ